MEKINLDVALKDERGVELGKKIQCLVLENGKFARAEGGGLVVAEHDDPEQKTTLRDTICSSLLTEDPQTKLSGTQKSERYKLWVKVNEAKKEVELTIDEAKIIKDCIMASQPILIAGQCEALLEG